MTSTTIPNERILELDGLRGLAILLVILAHFVFGYALDVFEPGTLPSYLISCLRLTGTGVDLFFVLSGFLIAGILFRNKNTSNYYQVFYIRRFFRIVPLYAVLCLAYLICVHFFSNRFTYLIGDPVPWPYLSTFTQNIQMAFSEGDSPFIGVTWSLAVEEQFYLFFPLIVFMLPTKRLPAILFMLVIAAIVFRTYFHYWHGWHPAFALTLCRMDSLFIGALAAWYTQTERPPPFLKHIEWILALTSLPMIYFTVRGQHPNTFATDVVSYTAYALFYCALILLVIKEKDGAFSRIFRARFLVSLGTYAYAIYLIHVPVIGFIFSFVTTAPPKMKDWNSLGLMLLASVVVFYLAKLSWRFFEAPLIRYSKKWNYNVNVPETTTPSRGVV